MLHYFSQEKAVIDPMVIFTVHGILDEQKYGSIVIIIFLLEKIYNEFQICI